MTSKNDSSEVGVNVELDFYRRLVYSGFMSKSDTKLALLQAGTRILREKGYNHTGIQEVLQETGVPKGSFYHYFTSKEDFGLQIIDYEAAEHARILEGYLQDEQFSPLTRLRRYFESKCTDFSISHCRYGCLLGNLGQELGDQNETFRAHLAALFDQWRHGFKQVLEQAQIAGEISSDLDITVLAEFCVSGWEGALMQMKISKRTDPLRAFITMVFDYLLKT